MANPVIPGVTYPSAYDAATLQTFIANNLDMSLSTPAASLVFAIGGPVTVVSNNIPLLTQFNQPGFLVVASPKLLTELMNSGIRFSLGFVSTLLPNLQTTIAKGALLAQTRAQTQTALNAVIAAFVANPPT